MAFVRNDKALASLARKLCSTTAIENFLIPKVPNAICAFLSSFSHFSRIFSLFSLGKSKALDWLALADNYSLAAQRLVLRAFPIILQGCPLAKESVQVVQVFIDPRLRTYFPDDRVVL